MVTTSKLVTSRGIGGEGWELYSENWKMRTSWWMEKVTRHGKRAENAWCLGQRIGIYYLGTLTTLVEERVHYLEHAR
jgi:hypothetical protein